MTKDQLLYHETHLCPQADADWMVFVHGAGGSTRTWRRQIDDLSQACNLLMIDLPGHGRMSERPNDMEVYTFEHIAEEIWKVVDHLKLKACHLVGVSLGAIIVLAMREARPKQTLSIILSGPILKLNTKLKALASISLGLAKIIGYPNFYKLSALIMMPRQNHKKSRNVFVRESRFLTTDEFRKWTNMYHGLNATLKRLFAKPLAHAHLLVSGEQDHLFLYAAVDYAQAHPEHTRLEIVPKCGHVVSIEKASVFNQLCLDFLQEGQVSI